MIKYFVAGKWFTNKINSLCKSQSQAQQEVYKYYNRVKNKIIKLRDDFFFLTGLL